VGRKRGRDGQGDEEEKVEEEILSVCFVLFSTLYPEMCAYLITL
jgi:hypothetical protein